MNGGIFKDYEGLSAGHTYTILGVTQVKDQSGKEIKLVKIKNPWATETYTGPWSANDKAWTDEAKQQAGGVLNAQDGTFFMPIADFVKHFGSFAVAMTEDTWQVSRADVKIQAKAEKKLFVKFKNPVQQDFAATFEGLNARMLPDNCAPEWPHQVPAQVAIIAGESKIVAQQIVFPQ